jgi:hypothetical protein
MNMAKAKKVKIAIYMNGEEIRYRIVLEKHLQAQFEDMFDMAGGLWNGKDEFAVKIIEI